ncbi:MAG TPA: plastocyanin/azurin family copper-binding protein [Gemmatimonadales bacterium]|nr:plastocyanin/azurin family copper-binding protein [Gemmatimonadales bacterium]
MSVSIQNYAFAPNSITVPAGTSVRWTNIDSVSHSVTSDNGVFTSSNLSGTGTDPYGQPTGGGQYTRTFFTAGTFPYHCSVHPTTMKGTVIVTQ